METVVQAVWCEIRSGTCQCEYCIVFRKIKGRKEEEKLLFEKIYEFFILSKQILIPFFKKKKIIYFSATSALSYFLLK